MAIDDELKAQILRYHFVEHWRVGTIASQLGVHHYIECMTMSCNPARFWLHRQVSAAMAT